jgi:hypothetical protein
MKLLSTIGLLGLSLCVKAQQDSYQLTQVDTIQLTYLKFNKPIVLQFDDAIVLLDRDYFISDLKTERKGLIKQINSRKRIIKKENDAIVFSQLKKYQRQFDAVDSIYSLIRASKSDTIILDYTNLYKVALPSVDYLPSLLENRKCMVLNSSFQPEALIIKKTGTMKTGKTTAVNSSFYYIPTSKKSFWSRMNWTS